MIKVETKEPEKINFIVNNQAKKYFIDNNSK